MYQEIARNKRRTWFLILGFIIFNVTVGWIFAEILGYGQGTIILAVITSLFIALISYYQGDRVALWTAGAQAVTKQENPYVYRLVENLCITAGIPTPKIHIIPDPAMNAFATGRDPQHASIALTTGIIEQLENEELEGVIAHELSHIKNFDIRLSTIVIILVGMVALMADFFIRARYFGFGRRDSDRQSGQIGAILMIIGLILAILSPVIAQLIQLAISRKREFLADASGALMTRYPEGLARALEKIQTDTRALQRANNATAHLYLASPFGQSRRSLRTLFSTHPPLEERIRILRQIKK